MLCSRHFFSSKNLYYMKLMIDFSGSSLTLYASSTGVTTTPCNFASPCLLSFVLTEISQINQLSMSKINVMLFPGECTLPFFICPPPQSILSLSTLDTEPVALSFAKSISITAMDPSSTTFNLA